MTDWEKLRSEIQLMIITYKDLLSVTRRDHHTISCALNNELLQLINHYSANLGISRSTFIKLAVIKFLEDLGVLEDKDVKRNVKLKLRKIVEEIIEDYLRRRITIIQK